MRLTLILLSVIVLACGPDELQVDFNQGKVMGYRPVYADSSDLVIGLESAREIDRAGKIYAYGDLLLVNEPGKGIHVFDNSNPREPQNMLYVSIPGNNDMAMKNGVLYADSYGDLLAMQVSADTAVVLKRVPNVMSFNPEFPTGNQVYFECVDEEKGTVVSWELTELENPKCFKP